ncbi:MAG TPA: hypothetical protein VNI81_04035 [Candidatus Limnocylindrales bacterium]|nr:hypothetical protein [Candidatus Limnocylindrales bacterium]
MPELWLQLGDAGINFEVTPSQMLGVIRVPGAGDYWRSSGNKLVDQLIGWVKITT